MGSLTSTLHNTVDSFVLVSALGVLSRMLTNPRESLSGSLGETI